MAKKKTQKKKKKSSYNKNIESLKKKVYKKPVKKAIPVKVPAKAKKTYSDKEIRELEKKAELLQKEIELARAKQRKKKGEKEKYEFDTGTIFNLNEDILKAKKRKYPKKYADDLYSEIKKQEYYNKKINIERRKLKKEQITRGTSGYRIKQIDQILKGKLPIKLKFTKKEIKKNKLPESVVRKTFPLLPENLAFKKNELNLYKGKDFYYYFDDGFNKYKIKQSELLKRIKKGENIGGIVLNNLEKKVKHWKEQNRIYLEKNKGKLSKKELKWYKNKQTVFEKLEKMILANKEFMDTRKESAFKDVESGFFTVSLVGTEIKT